jgi:hypothetical protein
MRQSPEARKELKVAQDEMYMVEVIKVSDDAKKIVDVDLASDVKGFIEINDDVECEEALKEKINAADNDDLLKVTKEIDSFTKILKVEVVDEELLKKEL